MIYICRVKRREKERREDDVCQETSQVVPIYDVRAKVSRLGGKGSRLIEGLVD